MLRKRPKNKRGLYGFREIKLNEQKDYKWADRNRLWGAMNSWMSARRDFDPRYLVFCADYIWRVDNAKIMHYLNNLPLKEKMAMFNAPWRMAKLNMGYTGAKSDSEPVVCNEPVRYWGHDINQ